MKRVTSFIKVLFGLLFVAVIAIVVVMNYSYIFSKRVTGVVVDVERVTDPSAIVGSRATEEQMYSYSVLIQGDDGRLYTSSSEDRQWQVVKKGYCVEALLYRSPPWRLQMGGVFFNARLQDIRVCPGQTALPAGAPGAAAAPAPNDRTGNSPAAPAQGAPPPQSH